MIFIKNMLNMSGSINKIFIKIWTVPFAQPKFGVLYALFAGIILGIGTDFVFGIFKEDKIMPWGMRQWAGVCFISASLMISIVALLLQFFNDHLIRSGTQNARFVEKCEQFDAGKWGGRRFVRISFALFWLFLFIAIVFLFFAYSKAAPQLPLQTIPNGV
jgi:hypothetical protein